jgi:hypothetical protein
MILVMDSGFISGQVLQRHSLAISQEMKIDICMKEERLKLLPKYEESVGSKVAQGECHLLC